MASVLRTNVGAATGTDVAAGIDFSTAAAEPGRLMLDLLPLAVFLVRRDARLLYANGVARAALTEELQLDPQRRCGTRRCATTQLPRNKIADAVKSGRRHEFALPREDAPARAACVIPMPPVSVGLAEMELLMLRRLARLVRALSKRIAASATLDVPTRIRVELLRLAREHMIGDHAYIDPAPVQKQLAMRIDTHREAVAREIAHLTREGILKKNGRALIVRDVAALERLVHGPLDDREVGDGEKRKPPARRRPAGGSNEAKA